jgi:hypothetical protein
MIIVTGTKRSGTSMWMQILDAAGFALIGEAFPSNWRESIRDANPNGFFESKLCAGVYFATNPDPVTGMYLFPDEVRSHAVKVFIPGVIKTELGFIDRCIATIRPWAEYAASLRKLHAQAFTAEGLDDVRARPSELAPELTWWAEYFGLIRDAATRRYPIHLQAYENLLADPDGVLTRVFEWIGDGDVRAACEAVDPALHRNDAKSIERGRPDLPPGCVETFDELYEAIAKEVPLSSALITRLNETHARLEPYYVAHQAMIADHLERAMAERARPNLRRDRRQKAVPRTMW